MSKFKKQPAQPSQRKKLSDVTWVRGAKPCKTLSGPITWTDKTHDKQRRHGSGGKVGGSSK